MALVRQAQYDVQYDGENGTEKVEAFVDTSTGQIFNNVMGGNSESGFTHTMVPTEKMWDNPNTLDLSGRYIYGSQGYVPQGWRQDDDASTWGSFGTAGASPAGAQIGQFMAAPTAKLVSNDKHTQEEGLDGQVLYRVPDLDDRRGIGQAWILPDIQRTNAYNPSGLIFYGSPETGFSVARTTEDDGTKGDSIRGMGNMLDANGIPIYGKRGRSDDSDGAQIGGSIATNPNYVNALARAGITPRYDPEWGWVVSGTEFNRANDIYMQSIGGGIYGDKGGWINQILDSGAPVYAMMSAIAGPAMGEMFGAATEAGTGAATGSGLTTASTVAGDAYLPGALSNPFLQAMPTVSSMAQSAATNAAMQLATTGTIDPEKIFTSVITGAAGSTLGNLAGIAAGNALDSNLVRSIVSGAVSGATQAAINGTDPVTAALASGAASGLGYEARENNINVPQQSINAVVNSIATGAPLENTLLNAAISIGIGAAKDAVSNISSADTQAPAPVETRTPISPLPADSGNVTTAELSDTSPSGYVIAGTEIPANADGSIYSGLSATGGGTNVAAGNTGTRTDTGNPLFGSSDIPQSPLYKDLRSAQLDMGNNNLTTDSLGNIRDENGNIVGEVQMVPAPDNVVPTPDSGLSGVVAAGYDEYLNLIYKTPNGNFVDSSGNSVPAPVTGLNDPTSTGDGGLTRGLNGTSTGDGGGLQSVEVTPSSPVQVMPEVSVTPDDEDSTPPPEVDWEPYVNSPDTNAPPTTTPVTPAVTTTVGGGGLPTTTTTTPAAAAGVAGTLPDVNRLLADDSTKYPSPIKPYLQPSLITTGSPSQSSLWTGLDPKLVNILSRGMAHGGQVHPQLQRILADRGYEMNPVEMVAGPEDRYYARHAKRGFAVNGPGTGQSDDIPTMLADGEYVFDADTVAALGDGSSKAGAQALDKMREEIRKHKRSAPVDKIPPKAKSPLDYVKMIKRVKS